MDPFLAAMAKGQGCAADGAVARNPMSGLADAVLGGRGIMRQAPAGPMGGESMASDAIGRAMMGNGPGAAMAMQEAFAAAQAGRGGLAGNQMRFMQSFQREQMQQAAARSGAISGGGDAWAREMAMGGGGSGAAQQMHAPAMGAAMGQQMAPQMQMAQMQQMQMRMHQMAQMQQVQQAQQAQQAQQTWAAQQAARAALQGAMAAQAGPAQQRPVEEVRTAGVVDDEHARNRAASSAMHNILNGDGNQRFKDSKFMEFMAQVKSGDIKFEDNAVIEGGAEDRAAAELEAAARGGDPLQAPRAAQVRSAWEQMQSNQIPQGSSDPAIQRAMDDAWSQSHGPGPDFDSLWDSMQSAASAARIAAGESDTRGFDEAWHGAGSASAAPTPYELQERSANPFNETAAPFDEGMRLFQEGEIRNAIMAFEQCCHRDDDNSEAWRMLGHCHAEHDEDRKAIVCLEQAVDRDPYSLAALLALGVSYVNEMDKQRALSTLETWVKHNPKFAGLSPPPDPYSDGSPLDSVMQVCMCGMALLCAPLTPQRRAVCVARARAVAPGRSSSPLLFYLPPSLSLFLSLSRETAHACRPGGRTGRPGRRCRARSSLQRIARLRQVSASRLPLLFMRILLTI